VRAAFACVSCGVSASNDAGAPEASSPKVTPEPHTWFASLTKADAFAMLCPSASSRLCQIHSEPSGYSSETGAPRLRTPSGTGTTQSEVNSPTVLVSSAMWSMQADANAASTTNSWPLLWRAHSKEPWARVMIR